MLYNANKEGFSYADTTTDFLARKDKEGLIINQLLFS